MKLNKYSVEICIEKGIIDCETHFTVEEVEVLKERGVRMVLDDEYFTILRNDNRKYSATVEKPSILILSKDRVWGTKIEYTLYTSKTKRPSTIKKEIEAKIEEKFGVFLKNIDLSIIK